MASCIHTGSWVHTLSEKISHSVTHPAVSFEVLAVYVCYAHSRMLPLGSSRNFCQDFHKLMLGVSGLCALVPLDLCLFSMISFVLVVLL
jgi:hypothetical protein